MVLFWWWGVEGVWNLEFSSEVIDEVLVGVVVGVNKLILFNFFFLIRTKVDKWVVGRWEPLEKKFIFYFMNFFLRWWKKEN